MARPQEFEPEYVASRSAREMQMYREEVHCQEPMKSMLESNPEIYYVPPQRGADWGRWEFRPGAYYDTTTGDKHPHWKHAGLPKPSKDIQQLRNDLFHWGYCKVENAIAAEKV